MLWLLKSSGSGHESRESLEVYSLPAIGEA